MTTYSVMYAAGCGYWEWQIAPTDETGTPIDPHGLPIEFAAVSAELTPASTWSGIVAQAAASAEGGWQGPDAAGYYIGRVLVSGPGGGGDIALPVGMWRMMAQITSVPERPVEETGRIVMR